jgi:hypothetical protein
MARLGSQDAWPEAIARRSSELVPVLPGALRYGLEVWLAMHKDSKATRRAPLAFGHLARGLADFLRGRPA